VSATSADAQAARRRAIALMALLTLVWGTNWPLFPVVMREISVWTFRSLSMTGAALLLLALARLRGQSLALPRQHWKPVLGGAVIYMALWNVASALAAVLIPSGQAAVLGFTMPVWAALLAWGVFGDKLSTRQWLAVALAACGVVLLMARSLGAYAQAPLGLALGLVSALGWAAGTLIIKRSGVSVPASVLTGWQLLVASVPITACALVFGQGGWFLPSTTTLLALVYITIVPMGIGNLVWFSIVGLLPAHVAGLSTVLVPVVAMVSGAIVHGEPLGPLQLAATACCAGALALALLVPARRT
jgi:drug/metabolite transporter (DMT)-like permease